MSTLTMSDIPLITRPSAQDQHAEAHDPHLRKHQGQEAQRKAQEPWHFAYGLDDTDLGRCNARSLRPQSC